MKTKFIIASLLCAAATPALAAPTPAPAATPTPTPTATATPATTPAETVITVTATRNPRPLAQTASSVTVITRRQLESRDIFDLAQAVTLAPGVSLAQTGTSGKSASVFIRGAESNHTLVLIDGVRANNPDDGRFDFGAMPAENIERIEVVRGPGSALYGSDAIGGVINIITRRGTGPLVTGVKLEGGSRGTNKQVFSVHGQAGKTGISLAASHLGTNGFFTNDYYHDNGASLRLDRDLGSGANLTFLTRLSNAHAGVPGQEYLLPDPFESERTSDLNTSLRFTNQRARYRDELSIGLNDRHLRDDDSRDTQYNFPSYPLAHNRTDTLSAQRAWNLGSHVITTGLEHLDEHFNSNAGIDNNTHTDAVFVQDEWHAGRLSLVPGLRQERNSQYGNFTSGHLAGAYQMDEANRLKFSVGNAFKAPTFYDLYGFGGNPNLDPERSVGMDLGIEHALNGGSLGVTYFYNHIKQEIVYDNATMTSINVNSARVQGLELSFDKRLDGHNRLLINQTFTDISSANPSASLRRPKYNTSADLLSKMGRWNTDLALEAQGRRQDADFVNQFAPQPYPGYTRLDLTLGYRLHSGSQIYVRGQNLLDRQYAQAAGYPAPGFNFILGFKTADF
jgi:vitamin B12 transporter